MAKNIDDETGRIQSLLQFYAKEDPKLFNILNALTNQVSDITNVVDPVITIVSKRLPTGKPPDEPENLDFRLLSAAIRLNWDRPTSGNAASYEVRQGTVWNTAEFVTRTTSTVVELQPIVGPTLSYLVKSISEEGIYSTDEAEINVVVGVPAAVSIDGQVIDNNVLLRWSQSVASFTIDYYEVKKGNSLIGNVKGTFTLLQELIAGDYTYSVTPVDIAGNRGATSTVTLRVNQPPDYVLTNTYTSNFAGAKTQVRVGNDPLLEI